jgi:hypothetical protein
MSRSLEFLTALFKVQQVINTSGGAIIVLEEKRIETHEIYYIEAAE